MPVVKAFERDVFLSRIWAPSYQDGEHVSILAPTGGGKTHLANQLLAASAHPQRPAISLVMKPRDDTVRRFMKGSGHRRVRAWPPNAATESARDAWRGGPAPGYVLWPKHRFDPDVDEPEHYRIFRRALLDSYKRGRRIVFADEVYSLVHELGLKRELITLWTKGRSMQTGLWGATQRPRDVPLHMYSQAEHLFLANDPDKSSRDRFGEIGGVDPRLVADTVVQLPRYWWLYIRRTDRVMCVIKK